MRRRTRKKTIRRLFACGLLLVVTFLAGPAVVGSYAPSLVVAQLLPELADRIEVESIRLSWTEPVVIEGVTVRDDRGRALADIPRIKTEKTLSDWLRRPVRLGTIEFVRPQITLRRETDRWNFEPLVAAFRARPAGAPVEGVAVKVTGGQVLILNEGERTEVKFRGVESQFVWEQGRAESEVQARLRGDIGVEQVETSVDGAARPWDVPLQVALDLRKTGDGIAVRLLEGSTPFGTLRAHGSAQQGAARLAVDLETLHALLGPIAFPSVRRMKGNGKFSLSWEPDNGVTRWETAAEVIPVDLIRADGPPLREGTWRLTGSGRLLPANGPDPVRIAEAALTLNCDGEVCEASVTRAVPWHAAATRWPLRSRLAGRIERWLARWNVVVGSSLSLPPTAGKLTGEAVVSIEGVVDGPQIRIEKATAKGSDFVWTDGTRRWSEPVWQVMLRKVQWNLAPAAIDAEEVVVQTAAVSAKFQQVSWDRAAGGAGLRGAASIRAQLTEVAQRLRSMGWNVSDGAPRGELVAKCVFRSDGSGEHVEGTVDVAGMQWETPGGDASTAAQSIPIGNVHIDFRGMRESVGTWRAEKLAAALGDALLVDLSGYWKIADPARPFALTGTYTYDLARIRSWWTTLPQEVRFSGKYTEPLSLKGTLPADRPWRQSIVEDWEGSAAVAWDRIESFGFRAGSGATRIRLQNGIISAERTTVQWSGGKAVVEPRLVLADPSSTVELVPPTRIERLSLTPAMCGAWLQFILPLAAQAASAEGELSIDLARCRVPMGDWKRADIEGTLTIHRGKIGPSAEVKGAFSMLQLAQLVSGRNAARGRAEWIELPPQQVACRMRRGQVFHRGLKMRVGPVDLASEGQVGLDERIDVKLTLHVTEKALVGRPLLAGLRGRDIEVPLQGTLKKPRLKADAVQAITRGLLERSANDLLLRGIDNLFKGP